MGRDVSVRQSMYIALCRAASFLSCTASFLSCGYCAALGEYRLRKGTSVF